MASASLIDNILSGAGDQEAEIRRQAEIRRNRRTKFLQKVETDGHMTVPDHKKAWEALKKDFPDSSPPLERLYPVIGIPLLIETSTNFYDYVFEDEDWFSRAFKEGRNPKDIAIINQWTFFVEQLGGPALFTEWRNPGGRTLVSFTHEMFRMTQISMKRWMTHMDKACVNSGMKEKCPEAAEIFLKFCSDFGYEMVDRANRR